MRSFRRTVLSSTLAVGVGALLAVGLVTSAAGGTSPSPSPSTTGPSIPTCPPRTPSPTPTGGPTISATPRPCLPVGTGSLGGRVTDDLGNPVADAYVRLESASGSQEVTRADADGTWVFLHLPVGAYTLWFAGFEQGLAPAYWNDQGLGAEPTTITLADGETVTGLDARLERFATVSGRVEIPAGALPDGATVLVERADRPDFPVAGGAAVGADGSYEIVQLAPGTYRVKLVPPPGGGWGTTYHPGVTDPAAATLVTLTSGQRLEGLDLVPQVGQGIAGTVTLPAGVAPSDVWVVVTPTATPTSGHGAVLAADGTYRFTDLAPGEYLVRVESYSGTAPVLTSWYRDATTAQDATPVTVAAGTVTAGVDLTPVAAARVTGVATGPAGPVPGVQVQVETLRGEVRAPTWAGPDGSFTLGGLPAGEHRIRFTVPTGGPTLSLYYRAPDRTTPSSRAATTVRLQPGATVDVTVRLHVPGPRPR